MQFNQNVSDETLATLSKLTIKQWAKMGGVSERQFYLARKLDKYGSPELNDLVKNGKTTLPAALRELGLMPKPSRLAQAKTLWPKLTSDEQRDFYQWIESGN